ncbi:arginase [Lysinibacillus telephonicus]|uniref:Arginase n=1 Tax=Lysinibacillus telephonicus TaxID=1714840 RepID=A0A3S0QW21_9BACI|nr:arginase [Lysinibacillus telephonicus]RTQ93537.1 arginase [Lysinibacillus telephonicus]
MGNSLLSIDWDYFISTENQGIVSYVENKKTIIDAWYKRYIQAKAKGKNLQKSFQLSHEIEKFWDKIKQVFQISENTEVIVSDSHTLSYEIAKKYHCREVYLFDAHSDLGYGGLQSLEFEVNCANWLGKLLKQQDIEKAHIIYSPFTKEQPEYFKQINNIFNINYLQFENLPSGIKTSAIHICRSGAWSPPWFDNKFTEFIQKLGLPYKVIDCPIRKWSTKNISFADQLNYMLT